MSKYSVSRDAYEGSRNKNIDRALNEYDQRVADYINSWYDKGDPGKYYFRNYDTNKEYEDITKSLYNEDIKDMRNYLNSNFSGLGGSNVWTNNYWTGNELDQNASDFINNQYNDQLLQLDRAKGRGILNESGYNRALDNLNNQKIAANTTLNNINQGIFDDYKADLTNKAQGFMTDLSNYSLDKFNTVNTNNWQQDLDNLYNRQQNNLQSNFNNATNGLNLFDSSDLIGNARLMQGVTNDIGNDLYNAIDEQNKKKAKQVGLGNAGLF